MLKKIMSIIFISVFFFTLIGCVIDHNKYSITFDSNGGSSVEVIKTDGKSIFIFPEDPTKNGHSFGGWYWDNKTFEEFFNNNTFIDSPITNDITVYANWNINSYSITFDVDGGNFVQKITQNYDTEISEPISYKSGYTFMGWYIDKNGTDPYIFTTMPDKNITLYAKWELNPLTISFHTDVGTIYQEKILQKGEKVSPISYFLEDDIRYSYEFIGWFTDLNNLEPYNFNTPIIEDLNLYPKFNKTKKTIDFNNMTISFLGDSITTFYDSNSTINSYYSGNNEYYYPKYSSTVKNVEDTWWHKLSDLANLRIGINNSWSGSSCYNFGSNTNSGAMNQHRINTLGENEIPNIIFIHIGTNDNVNGVSNEIFNNSYTTMIDRIQTTYPKALIFASTLGYVGYDKPIYNYTEDRRLEYNEIIKEIIQEKDMYLFQIDKIQTVNNYQSILGDSLHPSKDGMIAYANEAYSTLIRELQ
jgi:uncharacterized repeat protein (TIGR02543 family)